MFYSQFILAKKGPLGTIWIAAHLERKLRKNQVADTDIGVSVDSILSPDVPIALRLSSHLLLGVVRIYSRKVNYLFDDCSDALLKVKQAFRSTAVDLPPEQSKAPYHSITLPETFDLDDFEIPDNEIFQGNFVDHHVSTKEQITLQDTMDGVVYPSSQFGLDERFGDGDASQIGLDLDEELFLDKTEAAGTSKHSMDIDADPEAPVQASPSSKVDVHNEGIPDPSLASPANYFNIQAPSTPGLMEEPNLPCTEEALVSDDHMDEDHIPSEIAEKEVPKSSPSQPELSNFSTGDVRSNGNCHYPDEQEIEKVRSLGPELPTETKEVILSGNDEPLSCTEHVENDLDSKGIILVGSSVEKETNMAADVQYIECFAVDGGSARKISVSFPEVASVTEIHCYDPCVDSDKANLNGMCPLMSDSMSENDKPAIGSEVPGVVQADQNVVRVGSEPQIDGQLCLNLDIPETSEIIADKLLSAPTMPVLQACSSVLPYVYNVVDNAPNIPAQNDGPCSLGSGKEDSTGVDNASNIPAENDGPCSLGSGKEDSTGVDNASNIPAENDGPCSLGSVRKDSTGVSVIPTKLQGAIGLNLNTDQFTNQATFADNCNLDGSLNSKISEKNNLARENVSKMSDLPAPEKLLSIPNLLVGQPDNLFAEGTPAKYPLEGVEDTTMEKIVSGRKRSYTESTLTMQSLNSAESSGAAQSKRSAELVPDDDDLLSSILGGRKSTTLKMKPTPPVADTIPAKRQRVAVRASPHKRKVLVDDAMVLHGETIRQQLTNSEDIRRVRKKAPCTRLEVWMLQKQFLEDEIFSDPIFTGMSTFLISLHSETFDASRTRIVEEDGSKRANELDASAGATLGEETEYVGTFKPSSAEDDGGQDCGGSLETPSFQESMLDVDNSYVQKEMKTLDDNAPKDGSEYHASNEKVGEEIGDEKLVIDSETMGAEPVSALGPVSEVHCNSKTDATVDSSFPNEAGDLASVQVDTSCQLFDERCDMQSTDENAFTMGDACGAGMRDQRADITEKCESEEKLDANFLLEEIEGAEKTLTMVDVQDYCSLSVHDVGITNPVPLQDGACPELDQVMEGCQLDESVPRDHCSLPTRDEILASDQRHDGSGLTSNDFACEGMKSDPSCSVEADLTPQNTVMWGRENIVCWDADPKFVMNSTINVTDYGYTGEHADFGTDVVEHDTDFLNVDDDEAYEDYESDMPNTEEKRILDNTGWSSRTRAVANYLQVLFEKDAPRAKNDISLESLLAGKTRKEASRMFFETLVLKTKDYIHAEQESSFCDIRIQPQGKLLKSEF